MGTPNPLSQPILKEQKKLGLLGACWLSSMLAKNGHHFLALANGKGMNCEDIV
jgi:hypothetical protein